MPNRSSKGPQNPDEDENTRAFNIIRQVTREDDDDEPASSSSTSPPEKNPAAVALGRLGGKKGGRARAEALSPEQRREIAQKAAAARWTKKKE